MADNQDNQGFNRDGFLQGGTPFDWKKELKNIFDGVENKTDKILLVLELIKELLKKDADMSRGGGRPSQANRNRGAQSGQSNANPPTLPPTPIDLTVNVNSPPTDGQQLPPRRARTGAGLAQGTNSGRSMGNSNNGGNGANPPPTVQPLPPVVLPPTPDNGQGVVNPPPTPQNRQRDSRGRFIGGGNPPPTVQPPNAQPLQQGGGDGVDSGSGGGNRQRGADGRFTSEQKTFFERITDKIGGFFGTIKNELSTDVQNVDPFIDAARETADITRTVFKPLSLAFTGGKALFNLLRPKRNAESIAWFKKLFQQLRGIRQDNAQANRNNQGQQGNGQGGDSGLLPALPTLLAFTLPILIPMMIVIAGSLGLAFAGKKLFDWMQEKFGGWVDALKSSDIGKFIIDSWTGLVDGVSRAIEGTVNTFNKIEDTRQAAIKKTVDFAETVRDKTSSFFNGVSEKFANTYDSLRTKKGQLNFDYVDNAMAFEGQKNITGLTEAQTRAYAADVAKTESGGVVNKRNSYGFLGQYQFGADALADEGVINKQRLTAAKKMAGKDWYKKGLHKAFLEDSSNWNLEGGQEAFLKNKALQDRVFVSYTNKNIKQGMASKAIAKDATAPQIAGYAKAAHLVGSGAANDLFISGVNKRDAYGTDARKYAQQGMAAITNIAPKVEQKMSITPTKPSKAIAPVQAPLKANIGTPTQSMLIPKMPTVSKSALPSVTPMIYRDMAAPKPVVPKASPLPVVDDKLPINTQQPIQVIAKVDKGQVGQDLENRSLAHIVTGGMSGK